MDSARNRPNTILITRTSRHPDDRFSSSEAWVFMRSNFRISRAAWLSFSLPALALAALIAGCESGGGVGSADSPEAKQGAKIQNENIDKIEQGAVGAGKKGGANAPTAKFHRKPGAAAADGN